MAQRAGLALITGTSSGIGAAYAETLADLGFDLIVVARRKDRLAEQAARLHDKTGVQVEVLAADLADLAQVQRVEQRLQAEPDLTMLVNNAGVGGIEEFSRSAPDAIQRMIGVNVVALTRLTHAALPALTLNKGAIINVASGAALASMSGAAVYGATKAFVVQFTRGLHAELSESGVRVQALLPGLTRTDLGGAGASGFFDQFPAEWIMSPEDLVAASLTGLSLGELVCIPGLADPAEWEAVLAATQRIGLSVSSRDPALRYRQKI